MPGRGVTKSLSEGEWAALSEAAWDCRENAFLIQSKTPVGAAVLAFDGAVFGGCNVNHNYRCHDIHAEVNAISNMVAAGRTGLRAILVAAKRQRFTPCGSCMDWIMQFGGLDCFVGYQRARKGKIRILRARQLMPFYPKR